MVIFSGDIRGKCDELSAEELPPGVWQMLLDAAEELERRALIIQRLTYISGPMAYALLHDAGISDPTDEHIQAANEIRCPRGSWHDQIAALRKRFNIPEPEPIKKKGKRKRASDGVAEDRALAS